MRHALRMAHGIGDGLGAAAGHGDDGKALQSRGIGDGRQILDMSLMRELDPLAVRQTEPAEIVAEEPMALREEREPRAPELAVPIEFDVVNPILDEKRRITGAGNRVGDACAVATDAEANLLSNLGHESYTIGSTAERKPCSGVRRLSGPRPRI